MTQPLIKSAIVATQNQHGVCMRVFLRLFIAGMFLLIAELPVTAWASLGQNAQSIIADGTPTGTLQGSSIPNIQEQTVTDVNGTQITEFVSHGTVFGLTWSGHRAPDFTQIFTANYAQIFQTQLPALKPGHLHSPVAVTQNQLVVHLHGHMGYSAGSAYLPAQLPHGITLSILGITP